ncbi:ABC transporter ATP-binding protein [Pontibacter akesuensis]|uniref:ABC-type multidrug transport system, ATPase component n=1 Tax=Pontibacter akesuensis TaxID=388950 RepID=A0A1I7H692_9BACT|nr:ATP-binding cassette domain-containing protein [Pontibacter akesuensis]GHA53133.1 heme ABC exporter ATP-binding protein CcmA [Pontibacter akesuensis]SFU56220.1 ABC-type multidrug transport system, ATPase component [Pontibacter akesuensis]
MQINLTGLGKRYNYEWIFRNLTYTFKSGTSYAILGHNGSGKSTLLTIIAGHNLSSEGELSYAVNGKTIPPEAAYRHLSLTAPYLELIEEFTLLEMLDFHTRFKPLRQNLSTEALIDRMGLLKSKHKYVKDFSSGMKQRLKLGLAIYSDTFLLLLDEPTTNLDQEGVAWYQEHVAENKAGRLIIVGSNIQHEYGFCDEQLRISDYHVVR